MSQESAMLRSLVAERDPVTKKIKLRRNMERSALAQAIEQGALAWIDIVNPTREEIDWLTGLFGLSIAIAQDLLRVDLRPSLMVYPKHLFMSFFQPYLQAGQVRGYEVHCVMTDTCLITVRPSAADALEDAYERAAQDPEVWEDGSAYLLYLTARHIIDAYYPLLDRISHQLNALEEKLLDSNANDKPDEKWRKPVYRIKQQLINLRQMVAPQREVLSSAIGEARLGDSEAEQDLFRHLYERLLRVYDVIDSQRELSTNVLDMMQNVESRKMVEAVNRLTVLSMIFLPLTFLSAWFELGFATTSEPIQLPISGGLMFAIVIAGMIASTVLLTLLFKRRGWL